MNKLLVTLSFIFVFAACSGDYANDAAFVTMLGNDTLAVEQFQKQGNTITAKVVLRSPRTTFSSYTLQLDDLGGIEEMTQTVYAAEEGFSGQGNTAWSIRRDGDSLRVDMETSRGPREFALAYEPGLLPFIDMVHWPFELASNQAVAGGADSTHQRLLSGSRASTFVIARIDSDSMTIRHPSRGVMGVIVDDSGNILQLDAGLTTRKLLVKRIPRIAIEDIGNSFAARDQQGNPFGQLSGAEEAEFSFKGADFRVEYGSPLKRGRDLFGGIVPWGERWRTGANRATHFYTSKELTIGNLKVPAGEYTLFTIPQPDGGTLIINKQTGQNGQSYDESRDLGRVPMVISTKEDVTEAFTITVEESTEGGTLNLIWGNTVFSVDFGL